MRSIHAFTQQVLVVLAALLLAGCTASVDDAAPTTTGSRAAGSGLTFTVPPGTTLPLPTGSATPLPLMSGSHLDGSVKLPWSSVGRPMDGKVVILTVDVGCASVVGATFAATPSSVTITVYGTRGDTPCTAQGPTLLASITLPEPIGSRRLLHG